MASVSGDRTSIYSVIAVTELGWAILRHIRSPQDHQNIALSSKRLRALVLRLLWRSIDVPYLPPASDSDSTERLLFHERYSAHLRKYTTSMRMSMRRVDPLLHDMLHDTLGSPSCHRGLIFALDMESILAIRDAVDNMFNAFTALLAQTPRLTCFSAVDVPRLTDILLLVQYHCPQVSSISLRAHDNDMTGLSAMPRQPWDIARSFLVGPPPIPVFLRTSLPARYIPQPVFQLPRLRVLSLTNLPHDRLEGKGHTMLLVHILKACPGLRHLELSLRCRAERHEVMMDQLCHQYRAAGGRPLHLKALKLGNGCQLVGLNWQETDMLGHLVRLSELEDLHIAKQSLWDFCGRYTTSVALLLISNGSLPKLRRLTCPWDGGYMIDRLLMAHREPLQHLSIRVTDPPPTPAMASIEQEYAQRIHSYLRFQADRYQPMSLGCLMLPSRRAMSDNCDHLWARHPALLPNTRSLKIPLPTPDTWREEGPLWSRLSEVDGLSQLWLAADGLDQYAAPLCSVEKEAETPAARLAVECRQLAYVRILDWA
jgi:hypothetical protein